MNEADLFAIYPRLWHMAEDGSWASISEHGLLSTSALLDLYKVDGERRIAIESSRRPESVTIACDGLPVATVRDQKPMSDGALRKCLDPGISPEEWYKILNDKTFFWVSRRRLRRLLGAKAYRDKPQTVLTIKTNSLVVAHRDKVLLSPINSGSTIMKPQPRGLGTFLPIGEYPFDTWKKKRSRAEAIAELIVSGGVNDIANHVLTVHRVTNGAREQLWRSPESDADDGP